MRRITFPIINPELERVPLNEYRERVYVDLFGTGQVYLDGEPVDRFKALTFEVPNDATDEQIADAAIAAGLKLAAETGTRIRGVQITGADRIEPSKKIPTLFGFPVVTKDGNDEH